MTALLGRIKTALRLDFADQAVREVLCEEEIAARGCAMRVGRPGCAIQRGAFQTRQDLDRALEAADL